LEVVVMARAETEDEDETEEVPEGQSKGDDIGAYRRGVRVDIEGGAGSEG
jgi:hypothetical protein